MISILPLREEDIPILCELSAITFKASHGHSASEAEIQAYIDRKYNPTQLYEELQSPENHFYLAWQDKLAIGYYKLILNQTNPNIASTSVSKLDRIYVLEAYFGQGIGQALLDHLKQIAITNAQTGIWLFTWKENHRAVEFYLRNGFTIIGDYDFKISETHSNPNHQMYLDF